MEVWKDIPGYEGKYQASTEGRIRSLDRRVKCCGGATRSMKGRVLRPGRYCKAGHVSVVLGHGANGRPVHSLIALTFLGPKPKGMDICHNDGDPTNNRVSNLRYDTRSENNIDISRQSKRKLKIEDIAQIKQMLASGVRNTEICKKFQVNPAYVSAIKYGRSYGWLQIQKESSQ